MLKELILTIALQLQAGPIWGHYEDIESIDQYKTRLGTIAEAIAIESSEDNRHKLWGWDTESLAIATLVTWFYESRFDYRVHLGIKHPRYSQDNGYARCLGQIHMGIVESKSEWIRLVGTDLESTRRCAKATIYVLSRWFYRCKYERIKRPLMGHMIGIFGGYKSGRGCWRAGNAHDRAYMWSKYYRERETYLTMRE